jgi:AcrR family transcriptional regulator
MSARARASAGTTDASREDQILEAATRIFQERGYDATTIQAIADDVGILKGSLYYYIDTKEDLLYRIIETVHAGLAENSQIAFAKSDPVERLRLFIEGHVRFCANNLAAIGVFLHDFRALRGERRAEIVTKRDAYDQELRQLLREGKKAGVVRSDLDLDLIALGIFGMMNWMYQWYRVDGRNEPEDIGRTFAALVIEGLLTDAGGSA